MSPTAASAAKPIDPSMARTITSYAPDGKTTVRHYEGTIQFAPDHRAATLRGHICFAIPRLFWLTYTTVALENKTLDYFDAGMRPIPNTKPEMDWITLKAKTKRWGKHDISAGEITEALNVALAHLDDIDNLKVIWKEGEHGYQIDAKGNIKRKWKLLPF